MTDPAPKPLRILGVTVENFKRIALVNLSPDGRSVVVGGANEQGKSSLLDAIEATLRNPKRGEKIELPLRQGARRGRVRIDLGELVAELELRASGTELSVEQPPGHPVKKPRSVLDALGIDLAFDPLAFARSDDKAQAETLRALSGCDVRRIEAKRAAAYSKRTDINRDLDAARVRLADWKVPPEPHAPDDKVRVADLMEERARLVGIEQENERVRKAHERIVEASERARAEEQEAAAMRPALRDGADAAEEWRLILDVSVLAISSKLETRPIDGDLGGFIRDAHGAAMSARNVAQHVAKSLGEQISALQELADEKAAAVVKLDADLKESELRLRGLVSQADAIASIDGKLHEADAHNEAVAVQVKAVEEHGRAVLEQRARAATVAKLSAESKALTDECDECDEKKADALAGAKFPVAGLGFEGDSILFDGVPFRQSSQSAKVKVGCAIAAALNPRLKICIVKDGALLDDDSLRELIATLEGHGVQSWIEVVGKRDGMTVEIVDGRVKGEGEKSAE